jgi:hypothetical protein
VLHGLYGSIADGWGAAGVALILLTVPVITGLATARVLAGRRWQIAVAAGTIIACFVLAGLDFS